MTVVTAKPPEASPTSSTQDGFLNINNNTTMNMNNTMTKSLPLDNPGSYSSPLPTTIVGSSTTLAELSHLAKLDSYQVQKHSQAKNQLLKFLVANVLSVRLTRATGTCYSILVDHLKSDQKKEFATLYTALHDVKNSCEATRRFAVLEPELDSSGSKGVTDDVDKARGVTSWIHELPFQARQAILSFISTIRANPVYLVSRLGRLSSAELDSLAKFHQPLSPPDSVIATPRRGAATVNTPPRGTPSNFPSPLERLLSFHRNDPLYTMLHSIFAHSMGPDSPEDKRRTDLWATIWAKLFIDSKGEQFLFAILDSWAAMRDWPAKHNLEVCLMGLLQEGAFLLERSEDQIVGKSHQDLRGKTDLLAEEFKTKGVRTLFKVLDDQPGAGGIPDGVLELGQAILSKIEEKVKRKAELVIIIKWFFGHYLMSGIQYPEA